MYDESAVGWSGRIDGHGPGITRLASAFIAGVLVSVGFFGARGSTSPSDVTGDQSRVRAATQASTSPDGATPGGAVLGAVAIERPSPTCAPPAGSAAHHRNVGDYGAP
jgi:hypothetical protein